MNEAQKMTDDVLETNEEEKEVREAQGHTHITYGCFLWGTNFLYIYKSKAISLTGIGGPYACFLWGRNIIYT
jgi:hypothetical protein